MTADLLASIAGVILSLAFSYIPGLSAWFAAQRAEYKRLIMAGLLLAVALASVGLACSGYAADFGLALTCDRAGWVGVVQAFVMAAVANQGAYLLSKRPDERG